MEYIDKLSRIPANLLRASDYATWATEFMPADIMAHIAGGAGDEITLRANTAAFEQWRILPRVLRDFSSATTATELFGQTLTAPLILAPVAQHKLVHPDGELATAQAADAVGCPLIASTLSSVPLEDIAATTGAPKWFQLYWQSQRDSTLQLVRRAENADYCALVVTVDLPVTALRYREQRAGFVQPAELISANLTSTTHVPRQPLAPGDSVILNGVMAQAPTWHDLQWLREQTPLPLILKGVMHSDDALRAMALGMDGIVISNHGGRSLDSLPASLDVLDDVRTALGPDFPVLLDSGIRHGSDIFKALALGANAVLVGRLQLYALAVAGALGVAHMLRLLKEELAVTMALAGCPAPEYIRRNVLQRAPA